MQRLINPNAEKTFIHNETSYTIKPLNLVKYKQIEYMWAELADSDPDNDEITDLKDMKQLNKALLRLLRRHVNIDRDKLIEIIGSSIIKVDHPDFKTAPEYLSLLPWDDFWKIYSEVIQWTKLDVETSNFSGSSQVSRTAESVGNDVQKPAVQESEPVLDITKA